MQQPGARLIAESSFLCQPRWRIADVYGGTCAHPSAYTTGYRKVLCLMFGVLISGKLNKVKIGSQLALIVALLHAAAYRFGWMSLISIELSKAKFGSQLALNVVTLIVATFRFG
jgi:hypothetical protein